MKENTQEKNLIKKNEDNLLGKIKNFFKKLFSKKNKVVEEQITESTISEENNSDFKESIKITEDEESKLLELQRRYRRGEISEKDLTDEQIESLCTLYDKQIEEIQKTIELKSQKLVEYKRRNKQRKNA